MKHAIAIALSVFGCKNILGIDDPTLVGDGGTDTTGTDTISDAAPCIGTFARVCLTEPIPQTIDYTADTALNACDDLRLVDGVELCVVAAEHIHVAFGATVQTAQVDPIFVFVATSDIEVAGTLDYWNAGPDPVCNGGVANAPNGGAGGSFGTTGGRGGPKGSGGTEILPGSVVVPTTIRKGCAGGRGGNSGGLGGAAGGAIVLMAPTIHLASTARINASGGGGIGALTGQRGGGGGGSGGLVVLDSTVLDIDVGAVVIAIGGGGGEGAGQTSGGFDGARGIAADPVVAAAGGGNMTGTAGDGGDGGTVGDGIIGQHAAGDPDNGGGGGGGGTGVIYVTSAAPTIMGAVVPAARPPP